MGSILSVKYVSSIGWFQRVFGSKQTLPITSKSKDALIKEFYDYDEVRATNFYVQILTEIKFAVLTDDLNGFIILVDILTTINTCKIPEKVYHYKLCAYNLLGNINLVILASKSAALKVLEHLLSDSNNLYVLPFLIDRKSILPEDNDENNHNAFYYAIRSNETRFLKMLIKKWPNSFFEDNTDATDDILSNEYNELMIRKVHISKEMGLYINTMLVDLRFFQDNTPKKISTDTTDSQDRKTLFMLRVDFVLEKIAHIKKQFWSRYPDEEFVLEAKFIAKNIHMLKSQFSVTKFTYDKLPWEEMEFSLIIFIRACVNRFELDPLYHFVLNKKRVIKHLQCFSDRLGVLKEELKILDFEDIPTLKLQREEVIENKDNAIFKDLYEDFAHIRDLYTLETIRKNVDLALTVDVKQKDGQLLIIKVLQVIGENFKNTLDSPKLTDRTAELLFSALQSGTKDIISRLRNDLSHVEALSVRSEIEENVHSVFSDMQTDIAQMNKILVDVIRRNKAVIIKNVFNEIKECGSLEGVEEILKRNHISASSFEKELEESKNLNIIEMEQFEKLISQLQTETDKDISYKKELLRETRDMIRGGNGQAYDEKNIADKVVFLIYSLRNENSEPLPYEPAEIVPFSTDVKLFIRVLTEICFRNELEETKSRLKNIQKEHFPDMKKILLQITRIENERPVNVKAIEDLSKLIEHLEEKTEQKSKFAKEIFDKINRMVLAEKSRLKDMQEDFSDLISFFMGVISMKKEQCSDVDLRNLIQSIQTKFSFLSQSSNLNKFMDQLYFILRAISTQIKPDISQEKASFRIAIQTIFNFVEFRMGQVKWIKEFRRMFESDKKTKHRKQKVFDENLENQFSNKLTLLEKTVMDYHLDEPSTEKLQSFEKDPKLRSLIEILLLDSMTTLESFPNYLAHNPFYLDTVYPVVNGKNLRNYIAHGNTLVTVLIENEFTNLLLHAKKIIKTKFNVDEMKDMKKKTQNKSGMKTKSSSGQSEKSRNNHAPISGNHEKQTDEDAKNVPAKMFQDRNFSKSIEDSKADNRDHENTQFDFIELKTSQPRNPSTNIGQEKNKIGKQVRKKLKNFPLTPKESSDRASTSEAEPTKQTVKKTKNDPSKFKDRYGYDKQIGKKINNDPIKLKKSVEKDVANVKQQLELFIALSEGSMLKVMKSIRKGADIGGIDFNSWTSLHFASKGSSLEVLKFVLYYNHDPNVRNASLQTALHIAAGHGRLAIVDYFVQIAETLIDSRDIDGKTPLYHACENGHLDVVKCLLKHKAKTTSKDIFGYSPLHYAISNNHLNVSNFLIEKEYSVDAIIGPCGLTSLHIAASTGLLNVIDSLLKKNANVNSLSDLHFVPLHYAAKRGHIEVVKHLIAKGAAVDVESVDGLTPLHLAVETGSKEIVDILLSKAANANATYFSYLSPLSVAANNGYSSIVETLIDNGASVTTTSFETNPLTLASCFGHFECTKILMNKTTNDIRLFALHKATINGHIDIVKLLTGKVSDFNANYNGTDLTALHLAAMEGHTDIVTFFVEEGCDINIKSGAGQTKRNSSSENHVLSEFINSLTDESENTSYGQTALHMSASRRHRDTVRTLLKLKADVGIKDDCGKIPLNIIVMNDMADLIMEERVEVNVPDCGEFTALHLAAAKGNNKFIDYCIENGLEVNVTGTTGLTALQMAVANNQKNTVKHLLKIGAKVDVVSNEGYTAIAAAIENNNKEMLQLLLDSNAKMSAEEEKEFTFTSVRNGHEDIVGYFISKNINNLVADPANEQYPLHVAVQFGHLDIVKKLLKELSKQEDMKIKEINLINHRFMTPLLNAVALDFCEIAYLLLSNGADPDISTPEGFTPIHVAIMNGFTKMLNILLKFKANVLVNTPTDISAIELAIEYDNLEHVEILLQQSEININATDDSGCSLLHKAATKGFLEIVKHLVKTNCNANAEDSDGDKPIHYAAVRGHQDIVRYFIEIGVSIEERGEKRWSLLHFAAAGNHSDVCKFLLKEGLDVNVIDAENNSALHVAAQKGHIDVLHTLLQNGSYYDACNKSNKTPLNVTECENLRIKTFLTLIHNLFTAVKKNELSKAEVLLNEGMKFSESGCVNIRNSKNFGLLHYAACKGHEEIVNILLKYKANVNMESNNGNTPLHYACEFSHYKIVRFLLLNGGVFEAQSKVKKTPIDYATDKNIIHFLKLVKKMFKKTQDGVITVFEDLNEIDDLDVAKAIMRTKNKDGLNLATFAIVSKHPKAVQFNELFQNDILIPLKMADIFYCQSQYKECLKQYNIVLRKRIDLFGEDNPGVWNIQIKISAILFYQNNYDEALGLAEHVYEKREKVLGKFGKETLAAKTQLALILGYKGQNQQAAEILEDISNKQQQTLGLCHTETLSVLTYLTKLWYDLDQLEKALEVCEKTLQGFNVCRPVCWWVWHVENIKANILSKQDRYEEAMEIILKIYEMQKKVRGLFTSDLSLTLFSRIEDESLEVFRNVLNSQIFTWGHGHPDSLQTRHCIANIQFSQRNFYEALKIYEEDFEMRKSILGEDSPEIVQTQQRMSLINFKLKSHFPEIDLKWKFKALQAFN